MKRAGEDDTVTMTRGDVGQREEGIRMMYETEIFSPNDHMG